MNLLARTGALFALYCSLIFAADSHATIGQIHDREVSILERELVPLPEAMPANKYDFAPSPGAFKGVRTFGLLYMTDAIRVICRSSTHSAAPTEIWRAILNTEFQKAIDRP